MQAEPLAAGWWITQHYVLAACNACAAMRMSSPMPNISKAWPIKFTPKARCANGTTSPSAACCRFQIAENRVGFEAAEVGLRRAKCSGAEPAQRERGRSVLTRTVAADALSSRRLQASLQFRAATPRSSFAGESHLQMPKWHANNCVASRAISERCLAVIVSLCNRVWPWRWGM